MDFNKVSRQDLEDLTLLLLYLNSWDENSDREIGPDPILRALKEYDKECLTDLEQKNLISGAHENLAVFITQEGRYRAKLIVQRVLGKLG